MRLLYLFAFLPFALFAQPNQREVGLPTGKGWQELTITDGLSQGMIFDLRQDQKGFIWVATKDGLNRYDGHNFKVFTHDPYNDFTISDNYCSALLIDSHQRLWVGTINGGLNLFDDRTQRFYHVAISDQAAPNAGNYEIRLLSEDPDGNIWVGTDKDKFFRITLPEALRTGFPEQPTFTNRVQFKRVILPVIKPASVPYYIGYYPDGRATVGSTHGIFSFNWRQPARVTKLPLFAGEALDFHSIYEDPRQQYWFVSTSEKISGWHRGTQKSIALPEKDNVGITMKAIDKNRVAIATRSYLWLMSPEELFRQDSLTARNAFVALPPNVYATTNLLRDRTDNIWVGTSGYGIRKFNPKIKLFHSSLPNTSLTSIFVDQQGRTYVRYQYAYERVDRTTNRLVPFLDQNLPPADKRQRYMMQDHQGFFWVSNVNFETHVQHLFKFSPDWELLKKYPLPANTSFGSVGNQTLEDPAGNLWIGATNGQLLRFNRQTETFQVFSYRSLLPQSGAESETYALYRDRVGTCWVGTQQGLIRADHPQTTPAFSIYKNSPVNRQSLSNDFVSGMIDDPDQPARYLWVSTKGGGLERLDKQTGRFMHMDEAQGLPNKVVYGLLTDAFNNLWMSTNRGLAQFNPRTLKFKNYTKADGLQDDEFNTGAYFKAATGELLFGGINGLTTFRAADLTGTTEAGKPPLVNIVGLSVNNKAVDAGGPDGLLSASIEHTQALHLSHTQNLLTLEFGLMDYTNPAKNRFRYQLAGIDQDWVEAGTNRFANYAQLPDGHYRFQVMGSASGEVWSKPVELQIWVHPPVYRTWWAYLLYAGLAALLIWQLYRVQTHRLLLQQQLVFEQKEASRLAELDNLKTQFFTNISHEFRTPLTLLLGPLDDMKRRFPADTMIALMERNGHRLLSLINQLLDLSKLEAGQLRPEPENGDIAAFLRTLASSFTSLAESRGIQFTFAQHEPVVWAAFDRDKLEKIVTNLLANAFKFTPAGQAVYLEAAYPAPGTTGTLVLTVADRGIGIAPANLATIFERFYQVDSQANRPYEGTGIGLALVHELVKVLNGHISVASTEGVGTTFTVRLPLTAATQPSQPLPAPAPVGADRPAEIRPDIAAQESPEGPGPVLLIIDDNADIRAYLRSIFAPDYQLIEAEDGQAGLARATDSLPDLIICDLMMPRLDGFGFCRALKTQEATSHIPVVMLTAKATAEDRIEGFGLGADDYLTKPFNQAEIQARVRNLIQQRARLYQWFTTRLPVAGAFLVAPATLTTEQKFIDRLSSIVRAHLDDTTFTVEDLADAAHLSRVQLHRKLKALTNTTATHFIRAIRLAEAAALLSRGEQSVTQVAYGVGFDNLSYFAKVFQEAYGVLPSQYGKSETPVS